MSSEGISRERGVCSGTNADSVQQKHANLHQTPGTFSPVMRWCDMDQTVTELRQAAASARAFADSLGSAELKRSFRKMARRWETEADIREIEGLRDVAAPGRSRSPRRSAIRKH